MQAVLGVDDQCGGLGYICTASAYREKVDDDLTAKAGSKRFPFHSFHATMKNRSQAFIMGSAIFVQC